MALQNSGRVVMGVDDAGKKRHVYQDAAMRRAIEAMGFEFLMHHVYGSAKVEDVASLGAWSDVSGKGFVVNQENTERPAAPRDAGGPYRRPGHFFQPTEEWVRTCESFRGFEGVCYDEAEHWTCNGVWVTNGAEKHGGFRPHFFDAEGLSLEEAYEGNLHNLRAMIERHYPGLASANRIVATEQVFPVLMSLFARVGMTPMPKYMKETVTPVAAATTLGAVRQYGVKYGACLDLWGVLPGWPGHPPEELTSSMLFSHWTGADFAYVENINFKDALYRVGAGDAIELSPWGEVTRRFIKDYLPANPRSPKIAAKNFRPRIVIVRFPDSDWGQVPRKGYITGTLYGASNLLPDAQTRAWHRLWHLLSHGTIPATGLTWHAEGYKGVPFRFFFPARSVAVYDHLASEPRLYEGAEVVFLTGKMISSACLATLESLVQQGLTVVTPPHLAPTALGARAGQPVAEHRSGKGAWVVVEDFLDPALKQRVASHLGRPDEMSFVFDDEEVIFRDGGAGRPIEVETRRAV